MIRRERKRRRIMDSLAVNYFEAGRYVSDSLAQSAKGKAFDLTLSKGLPSGFRDSFETGLGRLSCSPQAL